MQLELSSIADPTTHFVLRRRLLLLICLFLAAMGLRIYHIDEPPLEFHATRQYRSLLIAREYYYESSSSVAESRKRIAQINYQRQGILEPPVMELLTSIGYRFFGEKYWIPRTLSAIFWLIGGGILYRISKKIADDHAALFSTAFYLFIPFAVTASRSFQPDPLMVMLLLASIYGILRYDEQPMRRRLFVAAIFSAIAILIKPVALFVIYSTFLTLFVIRRGVRRAIADKVLIIFMLGSLLPSLLFYFYGLFFASSLQVQAQSSFLPRLLLTTFFWGGWIHNVQIVVGFPIFIASLIGVFLIRQVRSRYFLIGMWVGYGLFCLTFNYHIASHDYYHLQLIPIVALSLGPVISLVFNRALEVNPPGFERLAVWSIAVIAIILMMIESRPAPIDRVSQAKIKVAEEIGDLIDHDTSTVYLTSDYGLSLEYHGELSGLPWPLTSDLEWERLAGMNILNASERFQSWFAQSSPSYFIVLDLNEFEQQPDLKRFLTTSYPVFARDDDYLIFDLTKKQ